MTYSISKELEQRLTAEAAVRHTTVDRIVEEAVRSYLEKGADSGGELAGPQEEPSQATKAEGQPLDKDEWLRAFRELQRSLNLTEESAAAWRQTIIDGRR
jgi:hypothetical protein